MGRRKSWASRHVRHVRPNLSEGFQVQDGTRFPPLLDNCLCHTPRQVFPCLASPPGPRWPRRLPRPSPREGKHCDVRRSASMRWEAGPSGPRTPFGVSRRSFSAGPTLFDVPNQYSPYFDRFSRDGRAGVARRRLLGLQRWCPGKIGPDGSQHRVDRRGGSRRRHDSRRILRCDLGCRAATDVGLDRTLRASLRVLCACRSPRRCRR